MSKFYRYIVAVPHQRTAEITMDEQYMDFAPDEFYGFDGHDLHQHYFVDSLEAETKLLDVANRNMIHQGFTIAHLIEHRRKSL